MSKKRQNGIYYTEKNIFTLPEFKEWLRLAGDFEIILEPFSGQNNLIKMFREALPEIKADFMAFDISPGENICEDIEIHQRDTLSNYPKGYKIAITNPPYLARNSATRRGLQFPDTSYEDLYQYALDIMLKNNEYVAAIIPESFITQGKFFDRLLSFTSLNIPMFEDTDCPVSLALFTPEKKEDFSCFRYGEFLGYYSEIKKKLEIYTKPYIKMKFNDPEGILGLIAIDDNEKPSIKFIEGEKINKEKIKVSSRAITRISLDLPNIPLSRIICELNKEIDEYRNETYDLFLTAFKGLRKDGLFRRRMDFKTAKMIITKVLNLLGSD